jgi:hypothetical protein
MNNNSENLIPLDERTKEEQREIAKKGGIASGEARRKKRDLRMALEALLEKDFENDNGEHKSGAELISTKLFQSALNGNVKAFEMIRDTAGQKPVEKIMIAEIDPDIVEEVEKAVLGEE